MSTEDHAQVAPAPISPESLPVIVYKGERVVTTEILAQLYGTDSHNIIKNYRENSDRFVEGTHYFKLEGQELRDFKHSITKSSSVKIARNVKALLVWTERGAARHAKMLTTFEAWEVFEKLEDCYFGKREPPAAALPAGTIDPAQQNALQQIVARRSGDSGKRRTYMWSRFNNHFKLGGYKQLPAGRFDEAVDYLEAMPLDGGKQMLLPLDEITPELRDAIGRKANALALGAYDMIRAELEREARAWIRDDGHTPQQAMERLAVLDLDANGVALVPCAVLRHLAGSVAGTQALAGRGMTYVHDLETATGRQWYGRSRHGQPDAPPRKGDLRLAADLCAALADRLDGLAGLAGK